MLNRIMPFALSALFAFVPLCASAQTASAPAPAEVGKPSIAEERFNKVDSDHNGAISKEEFTAESKERAEKRFKEIDANADGQATKEEMKAASEARKKARQARRAEMAKKPKQ